MRRETLVRYFRRRDVWGCGACIPRIGQLFSRGFVQQNNRFSVVYHDYEVDCLSLVAQHADIPHNFRCLLHYL